MTSVEEKYPFVTSEENIRNTDWAAGSRKPMPSVEFIVNREGGAGGRDLTATAQVVEFAPAWWKIIDEPIVNALDHMVRQLAAADRVSVIRIAFAESGAVTILNDGPGIEIAIHKIASEKLGREVYVPTFIFGELFQGSNNKKTQPANAYGGTSVPGGTGAASTAPGTAEWAKALIGGVNGLGIKLTNCFSLQFIVETVHGGMYFKQSWRNNKSECDPPTIMPAAVWVNAQRGANARATATVKDFTKVTFTPDYASFGITWDSAAYARLEPLVYTRAVMANIYARWVTTRVVSAQAATRGAQVIYNGQTLPDALAELAAGFARGLNSAATARTITTTIPGAYPWEIILQPVLNSTSGAVAPLKQLSIVNGIVVREGKHFKFLLNKIADFMRGDGAKLLPADVKFQPSMLSGFAVFINALIPYPSWTGQRKDVLDYDMRVFTKHLALDAKFLTAVGRALADTYSTPSKAATKKQDRNYDATKYTPAKYAGTKRSLECGLFIVEGDSAKGQLSHGIGRCLGWDRFGIVPITGVTMNARKVCKVAPNGRVIIDPKFAKHVLAQILTDIVGVNFAYTYDPASPTYKREIGALNYGYIILAVDADVDGIGNILPLILNDFELLLPRLIDAGFTTWFNTPIARGYAKKASAALKPVVFYSPTEMNKWIAEDPARAQKYDIEYYKGLGTHSPAEVEHMFKDFSAHLITYRRDERTRELMEIYFGNDPNARKRELSRPLDPNAPEIIDLARVEHIPALDGTPRQTQLVCVSDHLQIGAFAYQKDNLDRKLDSAVDGQNQAGRKILNGLIKAFKRSNKQIKVEQLAGAVAHSQFYHHGGDSLEKSITLRGFCAVGGKQLPFVTPYSNFGSRLSPSTASSPRYINCKLNKPLVDALFPAADYWLLPFNYEENKRAEPKYFMPIIPLAICESTELPAHGWKLKVWAQDVRDVIRNVRRLIATYTHDTTVNTATLRQIKLLPMRFAVGAGQYAWTGRFGTIRGVPHSYGRYRVLTVAELDSLDAQRAAEMQSKQNGGSVPAHTRATKGGAKGGQPALNNTAVVTNKAAKITGETPVILIEELPLRVWTKPYFDWLTDKAAKHPHLIARVEIREDLTRVDVRVVLQPGALEWLDGAGDLNFTDGIEEFFLLREALTHNLNFMQSNGAVKMYSNYADVIYDWFPVRAEYYRARIERQLTQLQLKRVYIENVLRYIDNCNVYAMSTRSDADQEALLQQHNYARLCIGLINAPKLIPARAGADSANRANDYYAAATTGADATYAYLLNLSDSAKSVEARKKRANELADIIAEYDQLRALAEQGAIYGSAIWLAELDALERVIEEGQNTNWMYEDARRRVLD